MKLRLEGDTLRLRLSPDELDRLLASGSLSAATPLPGGLFRYGIEVIDGDEWVLHEQGRQLRLDIPRRELIGHRASLPSKAGIAKTLAVGGGMLDMRVEVDVKRPRPASGA